MMRIGWLVWLSVAAWKDQRDRQVPVWLLILGCVLGSLARLWEIGTAETGSLPHVIVETGAAFLPGLFLLAVSVATRGALGWGDGLVFLISAGFWKLKEMALLLLGGLAISSLWGMVVLLRRAFCGRERETETIPFLVCIWPAGVFMTLSQWRERWMEKSVPAFMTVEASYVMGITLLSLACLIGVAYGRCREYTGVMTLHHGVERLRGQEEQADLDVSSQAWEGTVTKENGKIQGIMTGKNWEKEISVRCHDPEEFLRKTAIFETNGEGSAEQGKGEPEDDG